MVKCLYENDRGCQIFGRIGSTARAEEVGSNVVMDRYTK